MEVPENNIPDTSGVPEEIRKNIIDDLSKSSSENQLLTGKKVGVSVSDNEELSSLGYSGIHLRDLTIEIVRYLLINGATMIYGGDLRREGFTEILSELAYQYRIKSDSRKNHFINYFSYPIHCHLNRQHLLDFKKNRTEVVKIQPPAELNVDDEKYLQPDTIENKYIWARSLTDMRNKMISNSDARIIIGGKINNYLGKMPGIIEEALIAIEHDKPLYLIGALGGASKEVINAFRGGSFSFMENEFHNSENYKSFQNYYNEHKPNNPLNLESVCAKIKEYGLEKLSTSNGLTTEENIRLFETPHFSEMIYLVFKGLKALNPK